MFLIGGPPFSGTTLLTLMLHQGEVACLDEPDFHDPEQRHRGVPVLQQLFPDRIFPPAPRDSLTIGEAVRLVEECQRMLRPHRLGIKTCGPTFVSYAEIYKSRGYPVIAILRDIRDSLVTALPVWLTEASLNSGYRIVWENLHLYDLVVRYEDLVANPPAVVDRISGVLGYRFQTLERWNPYNVEAAMLKLGRHQLLKSGGIARERVGIWQASGKLFSDESHRTADMMGY